LLAADVTGCRQPATVGTQSLAETAREGSQSLRALYASVNAAQAETYRVAAALNPAAHLGDYEPCLRTDNAIGKMPSVLANPAYPKLSIEQRTALFHSLVDYIAAVVALLGKPSENDARSELGSLRVSVADLRASAKVHLQNDLVISDLSSALAGIAQNLAAVRPHGQAIAPIVRDADPTILKLIDILDKDVKTAHDTAQAAAGDAHAAWTTYADHLRKPAAAGRSPSGAAPVVRCAAPFSSQARALVAAAGASVATPVSADRASVARVNGRLSAARERLAALQEADPSAVLASLRKVDVALVPAARSPRDRAAAANLQSSLAEFESNVRSLYKRLEANDGSSN
jgi:hypothetical protein